MVWVKAPSAPDYAYAPEVVRALITGTSDAWMLDWLYLLNQTATDVNALCAAGPQDCAAFDAFDFLSAVTSGNRIGLAVNFGQLMMKLSCFAEQRLFGAYCVNTVVTEGNSWQDYDVNPLCVTRVAEVWNSVMYLGGVNLPAGTTFVRFNQLSGQSNQVYIGLADPTLNLAIGYDDQPSVAKTGLGGTDPVTGGYKEYDFSTWLAAHPNARPHLTARDGYHAPPNDAWCFHIQFYGPGGTTTEPYVPPPVDQPPTAIAPPAGDYPDIAALGRELDNIERKLHFVLEQGILQEIATVWPLTEDPEVLEPANDESIDLGDASGFIVTVSNPGLDVDESFGSPVEMRGVGRVVLGNGSAWMPPIPITVSPLLLTNLPPTITVCRVHVFVPATFTVQRLRRAAPVG